MTDQTSAKTSSLDWDFVDVSRLLRSRSVSPTELLNLAFERIDREDPTLNSFITVCHDSAFVEAKEAEKEILQGDWKGPLHGIPIGIKDLIYTEGIRTTMGSKVYSNFIPDYNATVVERIRQAGGVIIGKLNTHEFAYGPTGDRSYFGPVRNPYDPARISGGSSSGAGAAVARGLCFAAIGTDTGGSIRIPSAACGVVGMKPTFGRVSKYGVYPLSDSLDHVGPMTRSIRDNAALLTAIAGFDKRDRASPRSHQENFSSGLNKGIRGWRIGVPTSYYFDGIDDEVESVIRSAIDVFRSLGADIQPVDLPDMTRYWRAQQAIQKSEVYALHETNLMEYGDDFDAEVRERIKEGLTVHGYEYVRAMQVRELAKTQMQGLFRNIDVLVTPTLPLPTPLIGQREAVIKGRNVHVRSELLRLTAPTNLTGNPSLSIPCGVVESGLPVGLQLIGKLFGEAELYQAAYQFEKTGENRFNQVSSDERQ